MRKWYSVLVVAFFMYPFTLYSSSLCVEKVAQLSSELRLLNTTVLELKQEIMREWRNSNQQLRGVDESISNVTIVADKLHSNWARSNDLMAKFFDPFKLSIMGSFITISSLFTFGVIRLALIGVDTFLRRRDAIYQPNPAQVLAAGVEDGGELGGGR